jgi:SAM-dependent methyltransferase
VPSGDFEQIETVVRLLQAADPQSVLDIGVGFGKYGFLMREYLEVWSGAGDYGQWQRRLEGIEAFEKYVTPLHRYIYDRVHIGDALDVLPRLPGPFDLGLLIDVIEHFSREDGERLLSECDRVGRTVLIASPRLFFEQTRFSTIRTSSTVRTGEAARWPAFAASVCPSVAPGSRCADAMRVRLQRRTVGGCASTV